MLNVGNRVRYAGNNDEGTVEAMYPTYFTVQWDKSAKGSLVAYTYADLFGVDSQRPHVSVIHDDVPTNVALSNIGSDRTMAMSHNIGRMEATIEILYEALSRVTDAMDADGKPGVYREIDRMKASIIRCAEGMRDLPKVNGGSTMSDLKLYIFNNK